MQPVHHESHICTRSTQDNNGQDSCIKGNAVAGQKLVRINLSEQTDMMDLLGADLPLQGGAPGQFAWSATYFLSPSTPHPSTPQSPCIITMHCHTNNLTMHRHHPHCASSPPSASSPCTILTMHFTILTMHPHYPHCASSPPSPSSPRILTPAGVMGLCWGPSKLGSGCC